MSISHDADASVSDCAGRGRRHTSEQKTSVVAVFRRFDADGSGQLEVDEIPKVMTELGLKLTAAQV